FLVFFLIFFFFFQAEDGIRDATVTGVQTCALPICQAPQVPAADLRRRPLALPLSLSRAGLHPAADGALSVRMGDDARGRRARHEIGRASCREGGGMAGVRGTLGVKRSRTGREGSWK